MGQTGQTGQFEQETGVIDQVRSFNRFYTNILGLLDRHLLDSGYTLTQARLLYELGGLGPCTASALSKRLNIDKSYLSRLLTGFKRSGLIKKEPSGRDNRAHLLRLSVKGRGLIRTLIKESNAQIERLLLPLDGGERGEIMAAMDTVRRLLIKASGDLRLRPFTDADMDFVVNRQIKLYEDEYGFTSEQWKAYVTQGVGALVGRFDRDRDCMVVLEAGGAPAGCIAITHTGEATAQLRFFFVVPAARGLGAGRRLMDAAVGFCRERRYRQVFLWTFSDLAAARHLYAEYGFKLTGTRENSDWGQSVLEERWELDVRR